MTPPDLGSLAVDLRAHLRQVARFLTAADSGAVLKALIGEAQHNPSVAAALRTRCLDPQRALDRQPLDRALARGELPPTLDLDRALDHLVGPIYYRCVIVGDPIDERFVDDLVDKFLRAL